MSKEEFFKNVQPIDETENQLNENISSNDNEEDTPIIENNQEEILNSENNIPNENINDFFQENNEEPTVEDLIGKMEFDEEFNKKYYSKNTKPSHKPRKRSYPTFFYASASQRVYAAIIDLVLINSIRNLIKYFTNVNIFEGFGDLSYFSAEFIVLLCLYFTISSIITKGQTIGKIIMKIKVVSVNNEELDLTTILFRETVCKIIDLYLMFISFLSILFSKKKQSLGDRFMDTVVVKEEAIKFAKSLNI